MSTEEERRKKIDFKYETLEASLDQISTVSMNLFISFSHMRTENEYNPTIINSMLSNCDALERALERLELAIKGKDVGDTKKLSGEDLCGYLLENVKWTKSGIQSYIDTKTGRDDVFLYLGFIMTAVRDMSQGKCIEPVKLEYELFERYKTEWKPVLDAARKKWENAGNFVV